MAIKLFYSTQELEEKNETGECPQCKKVASVSQLLDVNLTISSETGSLIKCNSCDAVTFIHEDYTKSINITEPVAIEWETYNSHIGEPEPVKADDKTLSSTTDSDLPMQ